MLVIPSIDLRAGQVVRLLRGDYARETVYSDDPVAVVSAFVAAGARRVHVVDLDAARGQADPASSSAALASVAALAASGAQVQVGGGVRDHAAAQRWFDAGAAWVVIGSLAVREPEAARTLCAEFADKVLIALDVDGREARAQGWTQTAGDATMHVDRWSTWPIAGIVHTAIDRDGTLAGPALAALRDVCARFPGPVLASAGVTTIDDVAACAAAGAAGVIVGRALHEGLFDLGAALARFGHGAVA
ncbi:MAG TPA: HisA/HisF-related TIM barrel protein [Candidatus Dormibacteraeota bacterium]